MLALSAAASIILGCLGALFQKRVKRLLAYSSINNAGYVLAGLSTGSLPGLQAALTYLLLYSVTLLILFGVLAGAPGSRAVTHVNELGRLRAHGGIAVLTASMLFSLAGIPPLTGFWTKFFVLSELISLQMYALGAVAAFASIVSSFYYVSLVRILYFEEPASAASDYVPSFPVFSVPLLAVPVVLYPISPDLVHSFFFDLSCSFLLGLY